MIPSVNDYMGFYGDSIPAVVTVNGANVGDLDIAISQLPFTFITGNITYQGSNSGLIFLQAATDPQFENLAMFSIVFDTNGAGAYTLFVTPGVYYVRGFMDLDFNFTFGEVDPMGYYGYPGDPSAVDVTSGSAENINFTLYDPLSVEKGAPPPIPERYITISVRPNPFNAVAELTFTLSQPGSGEIALYDLQGRKVGILAQGNFSAGTNTLNVDGAGLASGVYFVRLSVEDASGTAKLLLLK